MSVSNSGAQKAANPTLKSSEMSSEPAAVSSSDAPMRSQSMGMTEKLAQISALMDGEVKPNEQEGDPQAGEDIRGSGGADAPAGDVASSDASSDQDDPPGGGGEGEPDAQNSDGDAAPLNIRAVAEALDLEPAQLYELEIPIGSDGSVMTLGELKNGHLERETAVREAAKRDQQLDEREASLLADQTLFAQVGHEMEGKLSEATKAKIAQRHKDQEALQRRMMLTAVPEFADEATFANWREAAAKFAGQFGYKPHELQITDHRMVVMLRQMMRTQERLNSLLNFEPEEKQLKPPRSSRPQGRRTNRKPTADQLKRDVAAGKLTDVEAVQKLIGG